MIILVFGVRINRKFHFFDCQSRDAVVKMCNDDKHRCQMVSWLVGGRNNGMKALRYRQIRAFFISKHKTLFPIGMPAEQFSFSLYLEHMMNRQVEELLLVEESTWYTHPHSSTFILTHPCSSMLTD
jgi:hypothetical protein